MPKQPKQIHKRLNIRLDNMLGKIIRANVSLVVYVFWNC